MKKVIAGMVIVSLMVFTIMANMPNQSSLSFSAAKTISSTPLEADQMVQTSGLGFFRCAKAVVMAGAGILGIVLSGGPGLVMMLSSLSVADGLLGTLISCFAK